MNGQGAERELIRLAVGGDRASLSALLLTHYDALQRHIARRLTPELRSLIRSDDVLQQTFVRAAQTIGAFQLRHERAFLGWLKRIAENLLKDARKRRRRERRAGSQHAPPGLSSGNGPAMLLVERIVGDSTAPSGRAARRENIRCLQAALASLPEPQREVIQRYYLRNQSLEEIAQAMNCSKDAVRGLCYRARKGLRIVMGQSSQYFSS